MSRSLIARRRSARRLPASILLAAALVAVGIVPFTTREARGETVPDHLVISEVVTGGGSASDELIELYNPTAGSLPLEGLEVVYASASGATVSRRAAWDAGAPSLGPGRHLLIANEIGAYATVADAVYASGMAATGGSVALRIQGASGAIDSVGWGTAASSWLEGTPASAPAGGSSLERLPGGSSGSTQDTGDNAHDFVERLVPDPQNASSPPVPGATDPSTTPTPAVTPAPSASISPSADPTPGSTPASTPTTGPAPTVLSIATARGLPDGATATIEGTALTGSAFSDGGGYVSDGSAGIAVLLSSGSFERGAHVRISGSVDDRFAQRTLRSSDAELVVLGTGASVAPAPVATGSVGESFEGSLSRVFGTVAGAPTSLSSGLAYDVDDGSGVVRIMVGTDTGIDTTAWIAGATVDVAGVVGQRDSSGTGVAGYRVQPRDSDDVVAVTAPVTPAPSASPGTTDPSASSTPAPSGVLPIASARELPRNARATVRGTVTMAAGVVDPVSAVIQDGSGAILLRVGGEVGRLAIGEQIQVAGTRSTLGGMETLRVTTAAVRLGGGGQPEPTTVRTGDAGEAVESRLVRVRGALVADARRAGSGSISFEIDDGSGPLRIFMAAALGGATDGLDADTWVEVVGILGQETSGAQPLRGYRVWPRGSDEVRVTASSQAAMPSATDPGPDGPDESNDAGPAASLGDLGAPDLGSLTVGATLVHGSWPELGVGGLLWDGRRLVAIDDASATATEALVALAGSTPVAVQLGGLATRGSEPTTGIPVVALGTDPGDARLREAAPDAPSAELPRSGARWVSLVGRLVGSDDRPRLAIGGAPGAASLVVRCGSEVSVPSGTVQVTGIGLDGPPRIVVACDGVRAAPDLAMQALADPRTARRAGPGLPGSGTAEPEPADAGTARLGAAALLGMGAVVLGAAAAISRRLGGDPDGDGVGHADDGEPPETPVGDDPQPTPRPLTLVALPRERGSP